MIYMQSIIEVRPEHGAAFNELMKELVAFQEQDQGWKLLTAYVQFTGVLSTYVDIWEMEDAAHYQRGLFGLRSHPDFDRIRAALATCVIRETITLGAPAAYVPAR
jgi:hypothetical protein